MMQDRFYFYARTLIVAFFGIMTVMTGCTDDDNVSMTEDTSLFVTLTDAVPDAILEIRYFSTYNFVGKRVDGYVEPTALMTKRAADSLRGQR